MPASRSTPPSNAPQIASPAYRLPALDQDFLLGDSMRGVRFLLEYEKAEEALRDWGVRSTIVVFGSARVREDGPGRHAFWYREARGFGRIASQRGGALTINGSLRDNVIATGGGPGVMEAGNRGAADVGAPTIGLNIVLPHEQAPSAYVTPDLCFNFHYFAIRKMHFLMRAKAICVFPGGFGTMDELFEAMTLIQTNRMERVPLILFGKEFWTKAINIEFLAEQGTISPADIELLNFVETADEAWEQIKDFYKL